MSERERVRFRMLLQRARNVAGGWNVTYRKQNSLDDSGGQNRDNSRESRSDSDPAALRRHGGAEQQGQSGIHGHRIIFLRRRKSEKDQQESHPAECQESSASRAVHRFEAETDHRREERTPGK